MTLRAVALGTAVLLPLGACADGTEPSQPAVIELRAGGSSACALIEGGDLWCWGRRVALELASDPTPVPAADHLTIRTFSLASASLCAVDQSDATYCWGSWFATDLGRPYGAEPTLLQDSIPLRSLDTHFGHGCGVTDQAGLLCWGGWVLGRRGQGTPVAETGSTTPNLVVGSERYGAVATGRMHTCGIRENGTLACWGRAEVLGASGPQVVQDDEACFFIGAACALSPVLLPLANVEQLAVGSDHSCARSGTALRCWGDNSFHQMGDGTTNMASSPVEVSLPEGVTDVAAGGVHTCALGMSGRAYCWGLQGPWLGYDGLGARPAPVSGDLRFVRLAAGDGHTCGVTRGHEVFCWGSGDEGQLGDGAATTSTEPVRVVASWAS